MAERRAPCARSPGPGPGSGSRSSFATCVKGCRIRCISPVHGPKAVVHASGPAAAHTLHKVNSQFRWPSSCQGCRLQNWRLWRLRRLRRLCSVMAGGTARPAAAEGEAGHEPGTGWPGPQVAALERGARAHGMPSRPSGQSTAVPKLNLRAFVVEADRSPRPRVTCGRINVGSELHYRNKFLR